jgi:foldase protein PrsA
MKKILISMLLVVLLLTGCGKVPKLANGQDAVVSLEGGSISVDDLYTEMKNKYALNVLINMIDTKILNEKYKASEEETKYIEQMKEQTELYYNYFYSQGGQYSSYSQFLLEQYGVSDASGLDSVFSLDFKRNKAVEDYAKTLVSDGDINKYYETKVVGDMKVSHILITVNTSDTATEEEQTKAKEEALTKAKEVITKLNNGEDFAKLAKEYSKDSSANNGGDIGYFNDGDNEEAFFEAAKKLKVGEYTKEPVETKYGYHIIKLTDQKEKPTLDSKKEEIRKTLAKEKVQQDSNLSTKALIELRKSNKLTIEDKDLSKQYENYIYNYEN